MLAIETRTHTFKLSKITEFHGARVLSLDPGLRPATIFFVKKSKMCYVLNELICLTPVAVRRHSVY